MIKFSSNPVAVGLGKLPEARAFGKILSNKSVGIFVGASLPGMVGRGEVAPHASYFLNVFVTMELGAVVERDGSKVSVESLDGTQHGFVSLLDVPCDELLDNGEAGDPFDEGEDAVTLVSADDGITLPMAALSAPVDGGGAFTDMSLSDDSSSGLRAAASLSTKFGNDAQVLPEVAAVASVKAQVSVNSLHAHARSPVSASTPDDLSGAPMASDGVGDGCPVARAETQIPAGAASPGDGVLMRLLGSVGAIVASGITGEFPADGCWVSIQKLGDATL